MSERVTVSVEVLNKVLAVLTQMPYQQVAGIVDELQKDVQQIEGAAPDLKEVEAG
jgi:hypothetical protein